MSLNLLALSEYWQISVGQTKVKSSGQKNRTTYLPKQVNEYFNALSIDLLTLEVGELDFLEAVPPGHSLELGGRLSNLSNLSHLILI